MHNYCLLVHRVPLTPTQCKIRSLTVASPNQLTNRSLSPVVVCIRECSMLSVGVSLQRLIFRAFASTPLNPYPFYFSRWRVVPTGSAVHAARKSVRTTKWNGKKLFQYVVPKMVCDQSNAPTNYFAICAYFPFFQTPCCLHVEAYNFDPQTLTPSQNLNKYSLGTISVNHPTSVRAAPTIRHERKR